MFPDPLKPGMKTHPTVAKVQRQACRALSNICVKNVDLKDEVGQLCISWMFTVSH